MGMLTLLLSGALLHGSVWPQPVTTPPPPPAALARAERYFARTGGQALLVMHRGRIVHEVYREGGGVHRKQMLASGSKSFVGVAAIAAVQDGLLRLDAPASDYLAEWQRDARKSGITLRQLLSLESGIESGNPGTGCGGRRATWDDALRAQAVASPGTVFRYGPFPFIVVGTVIERVQRESFAQYLQHRVLDRLGVAVEWRAKCGDGKPQLAGGAAMTARDWATFGDMLRRGGVHDGTRVLDETLVRQLFRPATSNANYGLSWWLAGASLQQRPTVGASSRSAARLPDWLPPDLVMAAGAGKQRLYLIPSHELVVVRMGPLLGSRTFDDSDFLAALLEP